MLFIPALALTAMMQKTFTAGQQKYGRRYLMIWLNGLNLRLTKKMLFINTFYLSKQCNRSKHGKEIKKARSSEKITVPFCLIQNCFLSIDNRTVTIAPRFTRFTVHGMPQHTIQLF